MKCNVAPGIPKYSMAVVMCKCSVKNILENKSSAWSNFVLQYLKCYTAHMVNKILILRQRNLSKQCLLRFLCLNFNGCVCVGGGGGVEDGWVVRWYWVNCQYRGVPLIFDYSRARAYCTRSRCGWGLFGHFYSRLSVLFSFSVSLGDGPI